MNKIVGGISILILLVPIVGVFAQVEEQKGNINGKIDKMQDVIDTCTRTIEIDPDAFALMKDDCLKFFGVVDANITGLLKDNRDTIENILYGG